MKFGGSSVKNAERMSNVAQIIKKRLDKDPIVVVSALGGITDKLIEAAKAASLGEDSSNIIAEIEERHYSTIKDLGLDKTLIAAEMKEFRDLIAHIKKMKQASAETMDHVQSFGERMSAKILAAHMTKIGIPAEAHNAYDVGIITNDDFGNAEPLEETEENLRKNLMKHTKAPVITGFIGKNRAGKITTLG